jgi:cytochrome c peroxidase
VGKEDSRNPQDWLFTDFTYDALGGPKNKQLMRVSKPDLGLCEQPELVKKIPLQKDRDSFCGAFKVPTLRNIAQTSPYLHNGFFTKLRDVVAFYATRDTQPARWFPRNSKGLVEKFNDLPRSLRGNVNITEAPYDRGLNQSPRLSEGEISAITAFLATLTDHEKH